MSYTLNLTKILKFAKEHGFAFVKIYKNRGATRFILCSKIANPEEKLLIEIPMKYTIRIAEESRIRIFNLAPVEQNEKHVNYWSLLGPNITNKNLVCCGNKVITIFKNDGKTNSYEVTLYSGEEEDEFDNFDEKNETEEHSERKILAIERHTNELLETIEGEAQKRPERQELVFQDENGIELTDEELQREKSPVIDNVDVDSSDSESEEDEDESGLLRSKLDDLNRLDDLEETTVELGEFYYLVNLVAFYKEIEGVKNKLTEFYETMKAEESTIRQNRLENLLVALSSLNQIITNSFKNYGEKEEAIKEELEKVVELFKKTAIVYDKTPTISEDKRRKLKVILKDIKRMIRNKKQSLYHIRDILNTLMGRLEQDIERMSDRCSTMEVYEEKADEEGEGKGESEDESEEESEDESEESEGEEVEKSKEDKGEEKEGKFNR